MKCLDTAPFCLEKEEKVTYRKIAAAVLTMGMAFCATAAIVHADEEPSANIASQVIQTAETAREFDLGPVEEEPVLEIVEADVSGSAFQFGGKGIDASTPVYISDEADVAGAKAALRAGLKERQETIKLDGFNIPRTMIRDVYSQVLNENPSFFYVQAQFQFSVQNSNVCMVMPAYDASITDAEIQVYEKAVQQALRCVNDSMTDEEKLLALHDYLAQRISYDYTYTKHNAYNAFVERSSVCQGYTLAYEELLNRLGIANSCATSDAMNHIWNMVQLGENWYHVDITWDDPSKSEQDWPGHVGHTYFLNSDAKITSGNHYGWESEHLAEDTAYDTGKYWQDTSSAVIFEGTTAYYLTYNGRALCQRDADGTQNELKVLDRWTLANGGLYNYCFGMLSRYGKKLYFNDQHNLYSLDPASGNMEVVYTYTDEDGDKTLYGSYCTNGKAELLAATGPNSSDTRTLFTIDLPKEESDEIEALNGYTITNGVLTGVEPKTSPLDALQNLAGGEITVKDAAGNTVDPAQTTKTVGTGWTFGLGDDGETGKITALIYGDVNGDGKITMPDMVAIRKHIMRVKMLDGIYLRAGAPSMSDAEDPTPSMWDMVRVRKYIMNVSDKVV